MVIQVQLKQAGKRKNQITNVPIELEAVPKTVEELLCYSVRFCIKEFLSKKTQEPKVMFQKELEDKASSGKITFGFFYGNTKVNEDKAIQTALQGFEDGIVVIFVDGVQKEALEEQIKITDKSVVTFVKLAMLVGRMW